MTDIDATERQIIKDAAFGSRVSDLVNSLRYAEINSKSRLRNFYWEVRDAHKIIYKEEEHG